ncbi:MAG: hypothetical protein CYG59_09185 [Chloroflexi bacterium]|nr:MAG: hypothetical protein CYG59_09185 [Chloroflexota bacterium]
MSNKRHNKHTPRDRAALPIATDQEQPADLTQDQYLQRLRELETGEQEAAKLFDQSLLTLAGGALGISFTFVEKFAPQAQETPLLGWSWFCLSVAVVACLISYLVAQSAFRAEQKALNRMRRGDRSAHHASKGWSRATQVMNYIAFIGFIVGLTLLGRFVYINLK